MEAPEIVVVGGGPGGLAAAKTAAQAGARVVLLDAYAHPGGQYYRQPPERLLDRSTHRQRTGRELWQRAKAAGVEIRPERVVWNVDAEKTLSVLGLDGLETIHPQALILAAGAYERLVAFPGWTLPGVITSGAAQTLLYQGVRPGRRALVVGTGPLNLVTGADLLRAGVDVAVVLEGSRLLQKGAANAAALWGQWERAWEGAHSLLELARHGAPYRTGCGILAAHGTQEVEGATIARLDADWRPIPGSEQEIACDTVCAGWSFVPFSALAQLAGAAMEWQPEFGGLVPVRDDYLQTSIAGIYTIGDGAGIGGYRLAMLEGEVAGAQAASLLGYGGNLAEGYIQNALARAARERRFQRLYARLFTPGPGVYELAHEDTLVCRCEGVTAGQVRQAVDQGAATTAEVRAITRCGMGECQGRVCASQVTNMISRLTGQTPEVVGFYQTRPPLFPLPLKAFSVEK